MRNMKKSLLFDLEHELSEDESDLECDDMTHVLPADERADLKKEITKLRNQIKWLEAA